MAAIRRSRRVSDRVGQLDAIVRALLLADQRAFGSSCALAGGSLDVVAATQRDETA